MKPVAVLAMKLMFLLLYFAVILGFDVFRKCLQPFTNYILVHYTMIFFFPFFRVVQAILVVIVIVITGIKYFASSNTL